MKAFLLADMVPTAGRGHAVRCAALSEALLDVGFDFAPVYDLETVAEKDVRPVAPEVVVFDAYKLWDDMIYRALGDYRPPVVVAIVDMQMQNYPVDLIVNGCAGAGDVDYPKAKEVLQGPQYALIRRAFSPEPKVRRQGVIDFREIQGMRAAHLAARMRAAEVGISHGGMRALELAATGTPAVLVQQVENQRLNVDGLVSLGAAVSFDLERHQSPEALAESLDASARVCMATRGPVVIDGRGSARVATAIRRMLP